MTEAADLRRPAGRRSVPDRLWVPTLAALALALLFVGALLVRADGDVSLLVHAAPPDTQPGPSTRGSLTVQPHDEGFDGQFFYRLGVDPWSTDHRVAGVAFDLPSLRNARWGYGALAFAASGGDPDLVPWSLVGLNVAAAAAVGAIGGRLARSSGRHAAWGVLLVLWPGFAYSLSLDTSELVAAAFLLGGLLALRRRRWAPGALLLGAAVLTRDTTAVVPFGLAVGGAWVWWSARHEAAAEAELDVATAGSAGPDAAHAEAVADGDANPTTAADGVALVAVGVITAAVFAGWQLLQRARFGALPLTSSGDKNLSGPFGGLVDLLGSVIPPSSGDEAFRLISLVGLLALLGLAAWCWPRSTTPIVERVTWIPAVVVVALLNVYLWSGATAFMRAATEAGLLSILVVLGTRRRLVLPLAGLGLGGLWLLTAAAQISKLG